MRILRKQSKSQWCISFVRAHLKAGFLSDWIDLYFECSEGSEDEKDEEEMDVDGSEDTDEVAHALAAVEGLVKSQGNKSSTDLNDIASRLNELMSGYDNEDDSMFWLAHLGLRMSFNVFTCVGINLFYALYVKMLQSLIALAPE